MRFGTHASATPDHEPPGIEALRLGEGPHGSPCRAGTDTADCTGNATDTARMAHSGSLASPNGAAEAAGPTSPLPVTPAGANASSRRQGRGNDTPLADTLDPAEREAYAQLKAIRKARRRTKLIRRGIVGGVVATLAVAVAVWHFASANQPPAQAPVVTQPVMRAPFTSEVEGSGPVKPVSSTVVAPQIDGTIETVNVVAGQQVAEGDVLFTVKNDDLDRAVAEAERGVRQAQSALDQARRDAQTAQEQLEDARNAQTSAEHAASQPTAAQQPISPQPTTIAATGTEGIAPSPASLAGNDDAAQGLAAAKEAVTAARQARDAANTQVEAAELQLETANDALAKASETAALRTVRAPASGSVIELNAQPGAALGQAAAAAAQAGSGSGALCQIADLSQMAVTVQVSEVDINKVAVGQGAHATFSAVPDATLAATVRSIASTSTGGADASAYGGYGGAGVTYAVELVIPTPDERLKSGMTASVSIVTESFDTALVVPTAALTDFGDGTGLLVVEDDAETHEAHEVTVRVRASNGSEAAVEPLEEGGLAEGDAVIVSGMEAARITDGDLATGGSSSDGRDKPSAGGGSPADVTSPSSSGSSSSGSASAAGGSSAGTYTEYDEHGNVVGAGGSATVG